MLQCGDRVLVRTNSGLAGMVHTGISWWLNSVYGHIAVVINSKGDMVSATVPKVVKMNIKDYFDGKHTVLVLAPSVPFTALQQHRLYERATSLITTGYDYKSYFGFLFNTGAHDSRRYNCSELVYECDKASGLFPEWDGTLVSPQSYMDFYIAGMFRKIFAAKNPTKIPDGLIEV